MNAKSSILVFGCQLMLAACAWAESPTIRDGKLATIGGVTFAVIEGTESKDGRLSVGWTLRPAKAGVKDADWSTWPVKQLEFLDAYDWDEDGKRKTDYKLVNAVLDRESGIAFPLSTDWPYFTGKNRGHIGAWWDESANLTWVGLVENSARFYSHNLWFVRIRGGKMTKRDLAGSLSAAVFVAMRKAKIPRTGHYGVFFPIGDGVTLADGVIDLPFLANIPKSPEAVEGRIRIGAGDGRLLGISITKIEKE